MHVANQLAKRREKMENQSLSETLSQMRQYAETVADAYVSQYIDPDGRKVMGSPVVYYNRTTKAFGWCSSLTPLSEDEVQLDTLEEGGFGETGDDPATAREAIAESMDYRDLLDKIEPEEENF
jgi:hypothetical protein